MRPLLFPLPDAAREQRELVIDSFAGGGGASLGIEMATGRSPDIAINHDAEALAMHAANHPDTLHVSKNIWQVDPLDLIGNRPVGLAWFSPDCKHHSKAKGGRPVKRAIRDLAWVVVLWARRVRPRIICLENVEEFRDWGPLRQREDGEWVPDPERRGQTFDRWAGELRRLGYRVEWKELRACDYGAPTIRKRLFLIARRDGEKIVWPEPTHGKPMSEAVTSGRLKPWRTAAEIIEWSLPCPSIFLTREEGRAIGVNRPLADKTMARIAKGVQRYVIDAAEPFIVPVTHAGDLRAHGIGEPLRTVTTARRGEHALVTPFVAGLAHGDSGGRREYPLSEPLTTIHAQGGNQALVSPVLAGCGGRAGQSRPRSADEPMATMTTKADTCLVAPFLVPRYGERPQVDGQKGQDPRTRSIEEPAATIVPTDNGGSLAAVALTKFSENSTGHQPDEPLHTVMAGAPRHGVVATFLAQHNGGMVGHGAQEPVSTIVQRGTTQAVVASHLMHLKGGERASRAVQEPVPTLTAQGRHVAEVRAFLTKYYGPAVGQEVSEPLHTATAKARFGLVTVAGEPYEIVDIGMRMLTARELFRAQGFPDSYRIDVCRFVHRDLAAGLAWDEEVRLSKTAQIRMCGNSVSPVVAEAIIGVNFSSNQVKSEAA